MKKMSRDELIKELDRVFSIYIRNRDASSTFISCISCGKIVHWTDAQCGHYIPRRHMITRYDEINCNAQCVDCNMYSDGNIEEYRKRLIKKYDLKTVLELEKKRRKTLKISNSELKEMIKKYK